MEAVSVIDIVGLIQGVLLGLLILFSPGNAKKANIYLGLFLITGGLEVTGAIVHDNELYIEYPWILFSPTNFHFLYPLLFYFYTMEITGLKANKKRWPLFIPALLEFLVWTALFLTPASNKMAMAETETMEFFEELYELLALPFMLYYVVKVIRLIKRAERNIKNNYSSLILKNLSWLKVAAYTALFITLFPLTELFLDESTEDAHYFAFTGLNTLFTFWVAVNGYRQTIIFSNPQAILLEARGINEQHPEPKNKNQSKLTNEEDFEKLVGFFESKKLFRRQELTINQLADEVNMHPKRVSALINQHTDRNFYSFVNSYRIAEAQRLMLDKKYAHLNLVGVAFEAGFNSKATFNAVFKKMTGVTPKEYKNTRKSA